MTQDRSLPEPDGPDGHMSTVRAGLVTLGLTEAQRVRVDIDMDHPAGHTPTHVLVDLLSTATPDQYLLQTVDAASEHQRALVLIGPLVFGWACSGQLRDLGVWAELVWPMSSLVVAPDLEDPETIGMASEVYTRLRCRAGVWLHLGGGLDALEKALEVVPDGEL